MFILSCRAYLMLILIDRQLRRGDFCGLCDRVRRTQLREVRPARDATAAVCRAVDLASVWYWKQVLCLQRSAATACLLRRQGIKAEMVIGGQTSPFRAHAWVEVEGSIVNDRPYVSELYAVLDRC